MTSTLKYIYDENGNKEFVIVPIEEWEEIKKNEKQNASKKFNPNHFAGAWKDMKIDWEQETKNMRNEWERDF